jgi:NodT family efflux transporter outer membrane factor (OMF) lipoprotein
MLRANAQQTFSPLSSRLRGWAAVVALPIASCLVQGCAVGPDFQRPDAPKTTGYLADGNPKKTVSAAGPAGAEQRFVAEMDIPGQWWTLFHCAALDTLIEESLATNADLKAARAALRVARENVYAQEGVYFPALQASFAPSRQRNAVGTIAPTLSSGQPVFTLYNAQVNVSYVLDVFGGNRRLVESTEAQAEAQRFQLEATYLTLTSNLVAAAVQEASLRGQVRATEEIIRVESEERDLLLKQFQLGDVAWADVRAQEATLAQTEATLPILQKQLGLERDLLTALAGRLPS